MKTGEHLRFPASLTASVQEPTAMRLVAADRASRVPIDSKCFPRISPAVSFLVLAAKRVAAAEAITQKHSDPHRRTRWLWRVGVLDFILPPPRQGVRAESIGSLEQRGHS